MNVIFIFVIIFTFCVTNGASYLFKRLQYNNLHQIRNKSPLYTMVWFNNRYVKDILNEVEKNNVKFVFIDAREIFDVERDPYDKFNKPLIYRDDKEIGWYDFYHGIVNM